ncbi:hypothetical protein K3495_g261 [Podosphaera aphanis]|nr:hypothetical protein K3495_g261 [Podosphaera aphanis]
MAKTATLKKKAATSVHSRAAKRASSPGIDLDKSLKEAKPPSQARTLRPSVLAIHQEAGVSKKSKKNRKMLLSANAKRRQGKGQDRAEAIIDKLEKKIERSRGKAKVVQERSKNWEELNKNIIKENTRERENSSNEKSEEKDNDFSQVQGLNLIDVISDESEVAEFDNVENIVPTTSLLTLAEDDEGEIL